MRYITIDELRILTRVADKIAEGNFTPEYKASVELQIDDTLDLVLIDGIKTLKYSNVLLIGIERIKE